MKPFRILAVAHHHLWKYHPHGGEISTRIILNYLKDQGFRIVVVHNAPQDQGEADGIKYWSAQGKELRTLCEEKIKTFKPQMLLSWSLEGGLTWVLSKYFGIQYIYFIRFWHLINKPPHINLLHKPINSTIVEKYCSVFKDATILVSNSSFTQKVVQRYYGCNSIVSYPPVSPLKKIQGKRTYLTLVNWASHKGSKVVEDLAEGMPNHRFLGVGGTPFKKGNLKVIPYTSKIGEVYAQTKILLCPSVYDEGFGRVALEALGLGIPVISYRSGGLPEVVGNGGLILDRNCSLDSWVEAVKAISTNYREFSRRALVQSRKFNWEREIQKIEKAIENVQA